MKTFLFKLFAICLLIGFSIQNAAAQTPFSKDSHVYRFGMGVGGDSDGISCIAINCNRRSSPIFSFTYDQGLWDDVGIGNIGVGGGVGIRLHSDDFFNESYSRIFVGARGTYHFDFVNSDQLDFYAGAMMGLIFFGGNPDSVNGGVNSFIGPIAGINYWVSSTFGVYAEIGTGIGFVNGGVAFNF